VTPRRDCSRRLEVRLRKGAIVIPYDWKTEIPGVFARHADDCPVRNGRACTCGPLAYRAGVREWETNRRVLSPDFSAPAQAQAWLREQRSSHQDAGGVALDTGDLGTLDDTATSSPPSGAGSWRATPAARRPSGGRPRQRRSKGPDLDNVIRDFLRAADAGGVDRRLGEPYAFETLLDLRGAMSYVGDELRTMAIADVRRSHIQKLVDDLRAAGLPSSIVGTVVDSLRALYAFAIQHDLVDFSPVVELGMPPEDDGAEEDGTWSHAPAPPLPPAQRQPPFPYPPATAAQSQPPPAAFPPGQASSSLTAPPQAPPYAPDWQFSEARAREAPAAPTSAMLALGGSVMTWTTRLALVAFALLVLVLARELGLFQLIR
jgi:hypothetical protein